MLGSILGSPYAGEVSNVGAYGSHDSRACESLVVGSKRGVGNGSLCHNAWNYMEHLSVTEWSLFQ